MMNSVVPAIGAVVGIWYLHRPAIRAELLGDKAAIGMLAPTRDGRGMLSQYARRRSARG